MFDSTITHIKNHSFKVIDLSKFFLIKKTTIAFIPFVLSKIAAGFPSPAEDYIDKTVEKISVGPCYFKDRKWSMSRDMLSKNYFTKSGLIKVR